MRKSSLRPLLAAVLAASLSMLPVHLLGASAVLIREDLHFDQAQLGLAVAAFFGAFGMVSWTAGHIAQTWGPRVALLIATTCSATALLGMATVVDSWTTMLVFIMIAGAGNAFAQTGGNLALTAGVGAGRQGMAFGLKQSAIPVSSLIAGAAVPVIGLTLGWRWSYAFVLLLAPALYALLGKRFSGATALHADPSAPPTDWPMVIALSVAYGGAAGASATLGAFLVSSAVSSGVAVGMAGAMLAMGSVTSILARLGVGWIVDRRGHADLMIVAVMLVVGAAGYVGLADGSTMLLVFGAILAFGGGWGWNGVFNHAIVTMNKRNPGTATGAAMMGMATGGVLWPLAFGLLVTHSSFRTAWIATAALSFLSALILALSVRKIRLRAATAT